MTDDNGDEEDGLDEAIVCYDTPMRLKEGYDGSKHIRDDQLMIMINHIRKKAGRFGQVILSMDVAHSGPDDAEVIKSGNRVLKTRGGFFEITSNLEMAPVVVFSACLSSQLNFEVRVPGLYGQDTVPVGAWTYSFYVVSGKHWLEKNYLGINDSIISCLKQLKLFRKTTPIVAGEVYEEAYRNKPWIVPTEDIDGDVFVISIGISEYPNLKFKNCDDDAILFVEWLNLQSEHYNSAGHRTDMHLLVNEQATYENILKAINIVISESTPDDYFFFVFAGLTSQIEDSSGKSETFFFPFQKIQDTTISWTADKTNGFSLHQLRSILEFIPAQNQLLVTEAGPSAGFRLEFAKSMIETTPAIAELTKRNRVIIVPQAIGLDDVLCGGELQPHGPLCYYLTEAKMSVFDLFSKNAMTRLKAQRAIEKVEMLCPAQVEPYMSFFYEKQFVEELQFFVGDKEMGHRGTELHKMQHSGFREMIGQTYALVVGTGNYTLGAPDWKNLANPLDDAKSIAASLDSNYGYQVKLLLNPSVDSLISALKRYSRILTEKDQFILFVAGHGDYDPYFFDDGFLVLSNSLPKSQDPNRRTYLAFSQLRNIVDNLPARQIMLMIDVCFGGAFDEKISSGPNRSENDLYADAPMERIISDKLSLTTRIVLSSGSLNTVPDGYQGKHSPFAARILSCLSSKGGERGVLTSSQLYQFVEFLPSKPVRGELKGNDGGAEFFLIPK